MTVKERFISYVKIDTQSSPDSGEHPSTKKQFDLAKILVDELKKLGVSEVCLDERCYVYAKLPSNIQGGEHLPKIGFIAHLDTEPVCSGKNVKPKVVLYRGGDMTLENGKVLSPDEFPSLNNYIGQEIVVTGGDTLLGADDKAGVAEILTAVDRLLKENRPHGDVAIAFTPDEEIGEGADGFLVDKFGADFAYTVDGEEIGELGYETFNAAEATVTFKGKNIHPGAAKGKMLNCTGTVNEFLSALPDDETPETTEGREGFYHVIGVKAEVEAGEVKLIVRDHDKGKFETRKEYLIKLVDSLKKKYGDGAAVIALRDQYYNCYEKIKEHFHLIENARLAYQKAGVIPIETPVRGGTDGSTLSFMGLPCPNLFTGGHNAHSVLEYIPVPSMEKAVEVLLNLIEIYANC